jgi:hypothetical protein
MSTSLKTDVVLDALDMAVQRQPRCVPCSAGGHVATTARVGRKRVSMAKRTPQRTRRRTQTLPPELVTFMDAIHEGRPSRGKTASWSEFPDLGVAPPLVLTVDDEGWHRLTVVDPTTHNATSGYVRRTWAQDRTLDALGVSRSGFDLRRRS